MRRPGRSAAATALVVLASVLLLGAVLAGYGRHVVFDSDQFAARATATLQAPAVRTVVAERVTDRLVTSDAGANLLTVRPLIASAVSGLVGGSAFGSLFHRAALDAHRAVFDRDEDTVALTVADVGTVAAAALQQVRPALADQLRRDDEVALVRRRVGAATGDLARLADRIRALAWILGALTVAAAAAALVVAVDRRRTVGRLGVGAIAAGLAIVLACVIGRGITVATVAGGDDGQAAARAVWDAFLGDLRTAGWVLAGCGAVVAAAAASLLRPIGLEERLRSLWRIATVEPRARALRLARAVALVAAGLGVVLEPLTAVQVMATLAGILLIATGLESVLQAIQPPRAVPRPAGHPTGRRPWLRRAAAPLLATAIVGATIAIFLAGGGVDEPPAAVAGGGCEGHAALCGRPLDEVVLPATHNAMSAGPQWYASLQDKPIAGQLADGIRGLLFDTHYGDRLADGRVRTVIEGTGDLKLVNDRDGVSPEALQAAERLRERLGFRGEGERGIYLCHAFCELGATPLSTTLDELHDFLVTHPSEVVVIINQDYVAPAAIVAAFQDAGLDRYAFTPPAPGARWPTLRAMIDADRRLVVLAENEAGAAPWYQLAYATLTQETPYSFNNAALLTTAADRAASCRANRGSKGAPLFLMNNWITTDPLPRPSNATKVNASASLLARARECRRLRGHLPTLLAVDFYRRGDLFGVVDALNGVSAR